MKRTEKLFFLIGLAFIFSSAMTIWADTKYVNLDSEHVRKLGRTYEDTNGLVLAFSSSGIEFNIKAKHLDVTIAGDSGVTGKKDDGSDDFSKQIMVDWEDRFNDDVLEEIGDMSFITIGLEKTDKGNLGKKE